MEDEVYSRRIDLLSLVTSIPFYCRQECRMDGVHAMLEHGIHGTLIDGAYSVVLSAGYKDDKDSGATL